MLMRQKQNETLVAPHGPIIKIIHLFCFFKEKRPTPNFNMQCVCLHFLLGEIQEILHSF